MNNENQSSKHIVIVAGEESGDHHASTVVRSLKAHHPDWRFTGIGGRHLQHAGMSLLFNLANYGVTGFTEVFKHLFVLRRAFRMITNHIRAEKPDLIILVDYPGFNLRLAKKIRRFSQVPILYYIAPQVWAWKANRLKSIKKYIDHIAVILPFEKKLYEYANVPVSFVGHPIINQLETKKGQVLDTVGLKLPEDKKLIALLPGSRTNEVKRLLPVFIQTINQLHKKYPQLHFVIPVAKSLNYDNVVAQIPKKIPVTLIYGHAIDVMLVSQAVIVASGTASLECALLCRPSCVVYKASPMTYTAASQLIRIPYIGLANILSEKMIMPELVQDDCSADSLVPMLETLLYDQAFISKQQMHFQQLYQELSATSADHSIDTIVEKMVDSTPANAVHKKTK